MNSPFLRLKSPLPQHRNRQALLPLEAAPPTVHIPSGPRLKCLHLLRELLQAVVLKAKPQSGSSDER